MALLRMLGPIQLQIAGRAVDLGSPKRRTVLACLGIEAGHEVSVETLIDRVWDNQPPADPRNVLYGHISRIRRALAGAAPTHGDAPRLLRRPGGYLLDLDADQVDVHRFTRLTRQAQDSQQPDAQRLALLREALSLWQGEPLAGLPGDWVARIRRGYLQRHLDAVVAWGHAELSAGDPTVVIGTVTGLLEEEPLVEPLVAVLMRALHAVGRDADALRHYATIRERLADELGTSPGPAIEELHLAILRDSLEPAGGVPWTPVPPVAYPVPAQLPTAIPGFVGRDEQLATLDSILDTVDRAATVVISALSGAAGVGKTTLAIHWAHRICGRFPDGQLYVDLRGFSPGGTAMDPGEAIRGFLEALDVSPQRIPAGLDAQAALYRSLLAGRRMLVVLDNARDAEQVRPLLPGSPGSLVLVTSRSSLSGLVATGAAHPVTLDLLTLAEAQALLADRLGAERVAGEPDAVDEIVERCARLPLALAIVATRAASHPRFPLQTIAKELDHSLDALATEDATADIRAVFSWSYRLLEPATARMFRLLSLHPGPDLGVPAAASLIGLPVGATRRGLAELARANLLAEYRPGRYAYHDLLRAYAAELAVADEPEEARQAARHRMLDHYLHTARTATLRIQPNQTPVELAPYQPGVTPESLPDPGSARAWFVSEHRVLLAVTMQAAGTGFDTHAWQLAWALGNYLNRHGSWRDFAGLNVVALAAADHTADTQGQAYVNRNLANTYIQLGRYDEARRHAGRAIDLFGQLGDRVGQANSQLRLAGALDRQGAHRPALGHAQRALALFRTADHQYGQSVALNAVGWYHSQLGEHREALDYCQQAVHLQRTIGDPAALANTWDSIGYAYHHLGEGEQAVGAYEYALDLYREIGDRYGQVETLIHLGDHYQMTGDRDAAKAAWRRALTLLDDLHHPDAGPLRERLAR